MSSTNLKFEVDLDKVEQSASRSHVLSFPATWASARIEVVLNAIGAVVNWIWFSLVLIIVGTVAMRYFVGGNTIAIEETQWHLYAFGFLFGIGYAIIHDTHVRVDVVAQGLRPTTRAVIEALGIMLIILPMAWLVVTYAIPFVQQAYNNGERSSSPGGLSNRWLIKAVIIAAFVYIALAAFARLLRVISFIHAQFGGRPIAGAAGRVLNYGALLVALVIMILPFQQLSQAFPPSARDVGRVVAQQYGMRSTTIAEMSCALRPGLRFGPVTEGEAATAPLVFGYRCEVTGVTASANELGRAPEGAMLFGRPLAEGSEASGIIRLETRYNPFTGLRTPLSVVSDLSAASR